MAYWDRLLVDPAVTSWNSAFCAAVYGNQDVPAEPIRTLLAPEADRSMPDDEFATMFGAEYYIEPGRTGPIEKGWPFRPPD